MTANVGLAPMVAVLLVAAAGESVVSAYAREETNCLAAPGAQAPPGRHWFYRIDQPKQRKCWYLRAQGAAEATAKAPTRHRLHIASAAPETKLPSPRRQLVAEIRLEPPSDPPASTAPDDRIAAATIKGDAHGPLRADTATVAEPSVSAPIISGTDVVLSPGSADDRFGRTALSPRPSDDSAGRTAQSAAERIRQAHAVRVTAAPDASAGDVEDRGAEAAVATPAAASGYAISLAFVFAGAMLVIAGIFLHPIVAVFARQPVFPAGGAAPVWTASIGREWRMPEFLSRWREARLDRREYHLDEI